MRLSKQISDCIDSCYECDRGCTDTIEYCLAQGGKHASPEHIKTLLECIDACRTAVVFMSRKSGSFSAYCAACADLCVQCARSCETVGVSGPMKECVELCRRCADQCRRVASIQPEQIAAE